MATGSVRGRRRVARPRVNSSPKAAARPLSLAAELDPSFQAEVSSWSWNQETYGEFLSSSPPSPLEPPTNDYDYGYDYRYGAETLKLSFSASDIELPLDNITTDVYASSSPTGMGTDVPEELELAYEQIAADPYGLVVGPRGAKRRSEQSPPPSPREVSEIRKVKELKRRKLSSSVPTQTEVHDSADQLVLTISTTKPAPVLAPPPRPRGPLRERANISLRIDVGSSSKGATARTPITAIPPLVTVPSEEPTESDVQELALPVEQVSGDVYDFAQNLRSPLPVDQCFSKLGSDLYVSLIIEGCPPPNIFWTNPVLQNWPSTEREFTHTIFVFYSDSTNPYLNSDGLPGPPTNPGKRRAPRKGIERMMHSSTEHQLELRVPRKFSRRTLFERERASREGEYFSTQVRLTSEQFEAGVSFMGDLLLTDSITGTSTTKSKDMSIMLACEEGLENDVMALAATYLALKKGMDAYEVMERIVESGKIKDEWKKDLEFGDVEFVNGFVGRLFDEGAFESY